MLTAQTSLSLCPGLRQEFRAQRVDYLKCVSRGVRSRARQKELQSCPGTSLYSDPQHRYGPMLGQGDQPLEWWEDGFHSDLQHRDGPVWWWARREGISKVKQLL